MCSLRRRGWLISPVVSNIPNSPIASGIVERTFVSPWDGTRQTYLEKDFRTRSRDALVFVMLHGAASHQDQAMTAGIYGDAFTQLGKELERRNALYICPEYRGGSWMGPAAEADLLEILLRIRTPEFCGKLILAGGSMGGTSALIFASRHPHLLDGVLALCPATDVTAMFKKFPEQFRESYGGSPEEVPEVYAERISRNFCEILSQMPIFLVHGAKDALIEVEHSRVLAGKLRERSIRFRYVEMPDGDHDAPISLTWHEALDFLLSAE